MSSAGMTYLQGSGAGASFRIPQLALGSTLPGAPSETTATSSAGYATISRKGFRFVGDAREEGLSQSPSSRANSALGPVPVHARRGQEITFCRTRDGVNLAVASVGRGPALVGPSHWMTHVEYDWQSTVRAPILRFLADRFRFIRYDCRNNGLSDWDVEDVSFEALRRDLETVVDALGLRSYALLGMSRGRTIHRPCRSPP